MNRAMKERLAFAGVVLLAVGVALIWPVATWLQYREVWITDDATVDAIYLVAGSHEQDRRINSIVLFLSGRKNDFDLARKGEGGRTNGSLPILIGDDKQRSRWSGEEQRNLNKAEWAVKKLAEKPPVQHLREGGCITIKVVPGQFNNTDEEMAVLAGWLKEQPAIRTLALSTSLYHLRRVVWRLRKYLDRDLTIVALKGQPALHDRLPWVVAGELCKMARDATGFSDSKLLCRH